LSSWESHQSKKSFKQGYLNDSFSYLLDALRITNQEFWEDGHMCNGGKWLVVLDKLDKKGKTK